jgi:branched-chain amino acid transport system permease protein
MDVLLSGQLLIAAMVLGALYALVALGLNLIYGTMRLLNVAHGELLMLGAYVSFWSFTLFEIGPLVSMFAAMAVTAAIGAAVYLGLFRFALRSTTLLARIEANSLLMFFGVSIILQNLAALAFTANPRAFPYLDQVIHLGDASITANRLAVLIIAATACIVAIGLLRYTMAGLAIRALIQQRDAAALVGIDVGRTQLLSFCAGFAMAGLAGALVSMTEQVSPFMGFPFTIVAFVVIILGGLGNLTGSLIGGLLLGVIETYGVALTSAGYRSILVYGVFIAVLLWRPEGLFGAARTTR